MPVLYCAAIGFNVFVVASALIEKHDAFALISLAALTALAVLAVVSPR